MRFSGLLRRDLRHAIEYYLATALQRRRDVACQNLRPTLVTYAHVRTAEIRRFERFFGCPVEFGAESDSLYFSKETLDLPTCGADPDLFRALQPHAEGEAKSHGFTPPPFSEAVENALFRALASGEPTAEFVAQRLALSPRTLSRRLADEGMTFPNLLASLRRRLAQQYIKEPGLSMEQIALLLGYTEVASFSHAFRRWNGVAPSSVRRVQSAADCARSCAHPFRRAYSAGARFPGIGRPARFLTGASSSRGFKAPMTRSVSDLQPEGAETVGPLPDPPPVM